MNWDFFTRFLEDLSRLIGKIAWSEAGGKNHPASDRYHITRKLLDPNYIPNIDTIAAKWEVKTQIDLDYYLDYLNQQIYLAEQIFKENPDIFYFDTITYRQYFENIELLKRNQIKEKK